jgi:hypothetical protein
LHGNADLQSLITYGNGMYAKWQTGQAMMNWEDTQEANDEDAVPELYDYGACTPQQLLFGTDKRLVKLYGYRKRQRKLEQEEQQENWDDDEYYNDDDDDDDDQEEDDDNFSYGNSFTLEDDGKNPCLEDPNYYDYLEGQYQQNGRPQWDFLLINDNSRNPCCTYQRSMSLELLESVYIPWIIATNATPIFLATYPYWASGRDMSGLSDIPTFASLTHEGYREYMALATSKLPASQKPRMAPVDYAFLIIWEDNPTLWADLMHYDEVHPSPSGTFLEACIIYGTIFGKMPKSDILESPQLLWTYARRMTPTEHPMKPYPTVEIARYLYHVAYRVLQGEVPKSLTRYYHNESADFIPTDSIYYGGEQ